MTIKHTAIGMVICSTALLMAQSMVPQRPVASTSGSAPAMSARPPAPHYQPNHFSKRAGLYYGQVWGVDSLSVRSAESGEIIRFSWRVLDPAKAKTIHDKKLQPALVDPQAGVSLVVPSLEQVGQLRQASTPEVGRVYWMAFSNKGRRVKPGDHVNVVIGTFRAEGLVVQ
jgi:hypothetical protein